MDAHYRCFEQQVLPVLVEQGIAVLGMKPLAAGEILTSGTVTDAGVSALRAERCSRARRSTADTKRFKNTRRFDATEQNRNWLTSAEP